MAPHSSRNGGAADDRPSTDVRILFPDERLRSYATFYYFVTCDAALEDFLYPEWGNVRFSLGGSWWVASRAVRGRFPEAGALFGPTDRAFRVTSLGGRCGGLGLTPLGWERLIALPADRLSNRITELGDLLGPSGEAIRDELRDASPEQGAALFDRLLLDRLAASAPNSGAAIRVDRVLREAPSDAAAFAASVGMTMPALRQLTKRVYGFGPKRLLRRQRFLETLGRIRVADQPVLSSLRGRDYHDQSHFNHEFQEFMGVSPTEYLSAPRPLMGQAALAQLHAGIDLSFRLPPTPPY